MKPLEPIAAVVLSTVLASAVNAQTAPATASPDAPAGIKRPTTAAPTDPVEAFLERTAERQRIREAALARRGATALVAQLRPLLANARIAPNGLGRNPQMRARLESALNVEVIQLLAAAGLRPADILRNRARGVDVFEAASAAIRGEATFQQQAALAQSIVLAEALDQRQARQAMGSVQQSDFGWSTALKAIFHQAPSSPFDSSPRKRWTSAPTCVPLRASNSCCSCRKTITSSWSLRQAGRARMQPMRRSCRAIWFLQRA